MEVFKKNRFNEYVQELAFLGRGCAFLLFGATSFTGSHSFYSGAPAKLLTWRGQKHLSVKNIR